MEDRWELGERLGGGLTSNPLVGGEDDLVSSDAWRTLRLECFLHNGERDDLVLESSFSDGGSRLEVALEREVVLLLSAHLVRLNEVFGAVPHRDVNSRIVLREVGIGCVGISAHRDQTHAFGPAGNDDVGKAGHNSLGCYGDGL